jgi:hypothetical protein
MKQGMVTAGIVALATVISLQGQAQSTESSTSTSAAEAKAKASTSRRSVMPVAPTGRGNARSGALPGSSSITSVEGVTPAPKKKWGAAISQQTDFNGAAVNRGDYSKRTGDAFIGVSYNLNDTRSFEVRQNFTMNQTEPVAGGSIDGRSNYDLYDTTLITRNSKAWEILGKTLASDARLYLPMSEYSQDTGKIEARYGVAMDINLSAKTVLALGNTVRGYYYTRNDDAQDGLRNYLTARVGYQAAKWITPYMELGQVDRWRHTGKGPDGFARNQPRSERADNVDATYLDIGADLVAGPIGLTLFVEQEHNDRTSGFKFMAEDELAYSLIVTAAM